MQRISSITFWDFLMFYQIFLSPQVKRWAIVTYINIVYTSCLTNCRTTWQSLANSQFPKKMNPHRPDAPAIPQRNRKAHKDSAPTPKARSHPPGKIPRANFHEITKFGLMYAKIPQTSKHILKSSGPNLDKIDQIVGELFTQWIFLKEILQNLRKIAWAYHEVPTFQASLLPNLGKCEKFLTRGFFSKTRPKPCWPTCVSL